jgi:hypothetical protein
LVAANVPQLEASVLAAMEAEERRETTKGSMLRYETARRPWQRLEGPLPKWAQESLEPPQEAENGSSSNDAERQLESFLSTQSAVPCIVCTDGADAIDLEIAGFLGMTSNTHV